MSTPNKLDQDRLDLIWGRDTKRNRGPKPSLTVDQIANAAIDLADANGLEAVSMKRLAEVLKVGTMTLYTYVPDKGALLQLMLDRVVGNANPPDPILDWRQHLRRSAEFLRDLYQNHPWMLQVNVEGPPVTPHQMRFLESILYSLQGTGLHHGESLNIAMSLSYYVLGAAKVRGGILRAEQESSLSAEEIQIGRSNLIRSVLDPEEFPFMFEAMTAPAVEAPPVITWDSLGFHFGLDRLIDGIAAYIKSQSG